MNEPSLGGIRVEKKFVMGIVTGVAIVVTTGAWYGAGRNSNHPIVEQQVVNQAVEVVYNQRKVDALEGVVKSNYIGEIIDEDMLEGIYKGYVYGVGDAYTTYLTKEAFNKEETEAKGYYVGTGIKFAWGISNQYLIVTEVVPNSPADKAGVVTGDKILAIDGIKTLGSNDMKIYEKLAYNGEDAVVYTITSNDEAETREVSLVADAVAINLVEAKLLEGGTGYIALDGLVEGTVTEIQAALDELINEGAQRIVLDIRGVYSDHLEEVQKLCDLFLDQGVVFSVKSKDGTVKTYEATQGSCILPLAVLTNVYTEGVIEAFPAAIHSFSRGSVVGEVTAGNGTTQVRIPLEDGSGLSITTGLVLDASGNEIKNYGVKPTIVQKTTTENTLEIVTTGTLKLENDMVLQKAIEVLK